VRQSTFRLRQVAVAALGAVTAVSGIAVLGVGAAGAASAPPAVAQVTPTTPQAALIAGGSNEAGSNLSFTIGDGFAQADKLVINSVQCQSATNYVGFAAVPTVTVTGATTNSSGATAPTFTASLAQQSGDGSACAGINDQLVLTVNNTDSASATGNSWTVALTGVTYNVGSGTNSGPVVGALYSATVTAPAAYVQGATGGTTTAVTNTPLTPESNLNAFVTAVSVAADVPPVLVQPVPSSNPPVTTSISPVTVTESAAGAVPTGYVCVIMNGPITGSSFAVNSQGVPLGTASVDAASGAKLGSSGALAGFSSDTGISFQVTTASTTAGTYTISGLSIVNPTQPGIQTVTVESGTTPDCSTPTGAYASNTTLFSAFSTTRVYGQVADATAAAQLAQAFPKCPGTGGGGSLLTPPANRPVVLATDQNFPDALSAAYLAAHLDTGVLLTPTAGLSSDTISALRLEGITSVYIAGGPLAVSPAVVTQLKAMSSYTCGGRSARSSLLGSAQTLSVTQIYGQTQYGTAEAVAQYFGPTGVGMGSFPGSYPTSTTGTSALNTTSGLSGTLAPASSIPTKVAILATGENYPDAMAASALAYNKEWPVLLTQQGSLAPEAQSAIVNLGIQQVIVMGGPLAISDAVVTQLEGMGVSVIRIAGTDYTDTAGLLAQFELNSTGLNWSDSNSVCASSSGFYGVSVTRGDFYTDALAGSALAGRSRTPILLTLDPNTLGTGIPALFNAEAALSPANVVDSLQVFGGPLAVSAGTEVSVLEAIASAGATPSATGC